MIKEFEPSPVVGNFPVLIEFGKMTGLSGLEAFLEWYQSNKDHIDDLIKKCGSLLLRDTYIAKDEDFFRFVDIAAANGTLNYTSGNSPRLKLAKGVYTSTEFPADREIAIHNELSYSTDWPGKIYFCSIIPAETGGETPIANSHFIYRDIPPAIRDEFEYRQIAYIRNLHGGSGIGASWKDTFETDDRDQVAALLTQSGIEYEWRSDDQLWMRQVRPAIIEHPHRKCKVWFNQVDEFHPSSYGEELYQTMLDLYEGDTEKFPMYAQFGDGGEIPLPYLDTIRKAIRKNIIKFPWQKGDLLILDNVLIGHGRMPFTGARRTLVAMTK